MLSWTLKPSLAYVGQGMIMGLRVAGSSMIGGALAWGFLGPMALTKAWVGFTAEDKPDVEGYPDNIELYGGYPDILFDAVVDEETGVCAPTIDPSVRGEGSGPAHSTTPPNLSECEQAVSSYEYGAKGWLTWLSLAIMLAEALTSLSFLALKQIGPACKAACGGDGAEVRAPPPPANSGTWAPAPCDSGRGAAQHCAQRARRGAAPCHRPTTWRLLH